MAEFVVATTNNPSIRPVLLHFGAVPLSSRLTGISVAFAEDLSRMQDLCGAVEHCDVDDDKNRNVKPDVDHELHTVVRGPVVAVRTNVRDPNVGGAGVTDAFIRVMGGNLLGRVFGCGNEDRRRRVDVSDLEVKRQSSLYGLLEI
jgi:hypothetical protein